MTTRTTLRTAHQLHLDRAARKAGEAFAFEEPEAASPVHRGMGINALWLAMALVALLALWLSF